MKVFAMSGSLRTGSWNTKLLNLAVPLLREKGVEVDLFDFRAANVPLYDPDTSEQNYPAQVSDARERIRAADGFLIVSPEYNNGVPGAFKNFVDFVSRPPKDQPWRGKIVAHLGATPGGFATLYSQAQIRQIFNSLSAWSMPGHFVISKAPEAFDDAGHLKDPARVAELDKFISRYVEALS